MLSTQSRILLIIIVGTIVLITVSVFLVYLLLYLKQKQKINRQEKEQIRAQFEHEILKSLNEIQNSTLQQVGQELHDNVGQLMSVAKINLNILEDLCIQADCMDYITATNEIIEQSLKEIRSLTKSLDGSFVEQFGLQDSVTQQMQRIRKTNKFNTEILVNGEPYSIGYDREIVLFRIVQEALNNMVKHSGAANLRIQFFYEDRRFRLILEDDGKGFDYHSVLERKLTESGAGLRNINRRCKLIGANCSYKSVPGQGTSIEIFLAI